MRLTKFLFRRKKIPSSIISMASIPISIPDDLRHKVFGMLSFSPIQVRYAQIVSMQLGTIFPGLQVRHSLSVCKMGLYFQWAVAVDNTFTN